MMKNTEEKNTELLIVDDLLLLLLDDTSGLIKGEGTLFYTLGGAVLVELALGGHVETDSESWFSGLKVRAVEGNPPSDPLLRNAYDRIAKRPRGVQALLAEIGGSLRGEVIERLLERGLIRRETRKVLGLFKSTRLPAENQEYENQVLESIRAVLEDGAEPDTRTAALASLLSASGTLPQFDPAIKWSGAVYTRGKELEAGNWGADAVSTAVARTAAAIAVGSAVAVSVAISAGTGS